MTTSGLRSSVASGVGGGVAAYGLGYLFTNALTITTVRESAVALGYLPLAVVGAVLFTVTVGGSVGKPTLLTAVGLAGVVYPIAFGTVGAALGATFSGDGAAREAPA